MNLNKHIRDLRLDANLTQKELSEKLSLTPKMISFYELGERIPPVDILIKLSEVFNVSIDFLLDNEKFGTIKSTEPFYLYNNLNKLQQAQVIGFMKGMMGVTTENLRTENMKKGG